MTWFLHFSVGFLNLWTQQAAQWMKKWHTMLDCENVFHERIHHVRWTFSSTLRNQGSNVQLFILVTNHQQGIPTAPELGWEPSANDFNPNDFAITTSCYEVWQPCYLISFFCRQNVNRRSHRDLPSVTTDRDGDLRSSFISVPFIVHHDCYEHLVIWLKSNLERVVLILKRPTWAS